MLVERVNQAALIDRLKHIGSICRMVTWLRPWQLLSIQKQTKVFSNNYLAVTKYKVLQEVLGHSSRTVVVCVAMTY